MSAGVHRAAEVDRRSAPVPAPSTSSARASNACNGSAGTPAGVRFGVAGGVKVVETRRAILFALDSVNQMFPSPPCVIPPPPGFGLGVANSVNTPAGVRRPTLPGTSANHRLPSRPVATANGDALTVGITNSVSAPAVVMRPILLPIFSVNHRLPSGPATMPAGWPAAGNSVTVPAVVIRPTLPAIDSVNQRFPSGPAVMKPEKAIAVGMLNSVITPAGVMRPILAVLVSVNHRLPSGPATMPRGLLFGVGRGNSVIVPVGVIFPTLFPLNSVNHTLPSGPLAIPSNGNEAAVGMGNSVMVTCPVASEAKARKSTKYSASRESVTCLITAILLVWNKYFCTESHISGIVIKYSSFSSTPESFRLRASFIRKCSLRAASSYEIPSLLTFEIQLRSASVRPSRGFHVR